jgi:hypothetical protein
MTVLSCSTSCAAEQRERRDGFDSEYYRPQVQSTTARDGATFTWNVAAHSTCNSLRCFDALARPTRIVRSSLNHSKINRGATG